MSSYTGLYVQRLSNGDIDSVQVVDPFGNSLPLAPETYIERQVSPPIDQLPDIKNYKPASAEPQISPVILALADWVKDRKVSDEALYRIQQFGFVYADEKGHLQLTPSGAQTLRENGLVQPCIREGLADKRSLYGLWLSNFRGSGQVL
ncbi:MAG: hypothetical protein WC091_20035 [Sulfuricellaceae bacterium]